MVCTVSAWFFGHLSLWFDRDRTGQIEDWTGIEDKCIPRERERAKNVLPYLARPVFQERHKQQDQNMSKIFSEDLGLRLTLRPFLKV